MIETKKYVRIDQHGAMRIGATRVSLDSVVYAFQQGHSPETIQDQYPSLSLEEVYGAIAYYLANRKEVHAPQRYPNAPARRNNDSGFLVGRNNIGGVRGISENLR